MTTMIGYLGVSTEEQATSGLGLAAQRDTRTSRHSAGSASSDIGGLGFEGRVGGGLGGAKIAAR